MCLEIQAGNLLCSKIPCNDQELPALPVGLDYVVQVMCAWKASTLYRSFANRGRKTKLLQRVSSLNRYYKFCAFGSLCRVVFDT